MNISGILIAAALVGGIGLFIGLFLGVAGIKFKVEVDEKEEAVLAVLPGNNCGGCGFAGCSGLAAAIAKGEAEVGTCPVGGEPVAKQIAEIMGVDSDPFYGAPVVLIVLADKARPTYVYDGSLVMGNLMLAAHAEGIGSCWIHRAKEEFESAEGKAFLKSLGIEGDYEGIGHCVLGYTDGEEPKAMPRKENYVYYVK